MQSLPYAMPFEILLIAGLEPVYAGGYSSSVFFSLKPEQVLFYIERPNDKYLPVLKRMGIVSDKDVISLKDWDK